LNLLNFLEKILPYEGRPEDTAEMLCELYKMALRRRSMVSPVNLVWIIKESYRLSLESGEPGASLRTIVANVKRMYVEALGSAVRGAERLLERCDKVLTLSKSSQVSATLKRLHRLEVRVLAGWPLMDGVSAQNELVKAGVKARLFPDLSIYEALEDVDAVFLGCDAVLTDGSAVNRSGSKMAAAAARELGVRVIVIGDSTKLDVNRLWEPEEWSLTIEGNSVEFQVFEKIGSEKVSEYVFEFGSSTPLDVVARAQREVTVTWPRRAAGLE
ncbi:MAG: hypothetical protein QXJ80_04885, partial [Nitrososphaerota archaeon]